MRGCRVRIQHLASLLRQSRRVLFRNMRRRWRRKTIKAGKRTFVYRCSSNWGALIQKPTNSHPPLPFNQIKTWFKRNGEGTDKSIAVYWGKRKVENGKRKPSGDACEARRRWLSRLWWNRQEDMTPTLDRGNQEVANRAAIDFQLDDKSSLPTWLRSFTMFI